MMFNRDTGEICLREEDVDDDLNFVTLNPEAESLVNSAFYGVVRMTLSEKSPLRKRLVEMTTPAKKPRGRKVK